MTNMNEFEFIQSTKTAKANNKIRVSLYKHRSIANGYMMVILIGQDVAKKAGLSKGSKIQVGVNKNNHRKAILKKSDTGLAVGVINGKSNNFSFRVAVSYWEVFQIKPEDFPSGEVKYTIDEDNNILFEI